VTRLSALGYDEAPLKSIRAKLFREKDLIAVVSEKDEGGAYAVDDDTARAMFDTLI